MSQYLIAFVDDEKDLTEGYRELFQDSFQVQTFDDGASYLNYISKFETNPFNVTVTDFKMGEINGIEMIHRATKLKRACPFIVMSGHVDKEIAISAANQDCPVKIVEKPADIAELEKLIHHFCTLQKRTG